MATLIGKRQGDHLVVEHTYPRSAWIWAITRLSLGWIFLWAFLDRLLALGFPTGRGADGSIDRASAWINGGSPTSDFLTSATGPFAGRFKELAGQAWVDWIVMVGLAAIGLALILGIGLRIAAAAGTALLLLSWAATIGPEDNPFMDHRPVYALVLIGLALVNAGRTLGFGTRWGHTRLVHRLPFLQ